MSQHWRPTVTTYNVGRQYYTQFHNVLPFTSIWHQRIHIRYKGWENTDTHCVYRVPRSEPQIRWRFWLVMAPALKCTWYLCGLLISLLWLCHVQTSLCVQVLRSAILAVLLHSTRAVGVSETLRRGTRNGTTELSQRAPPIFGLAAITLGIGPHSSLFSGTAKRK